MPDPHLVAQCRHEELAQLSHLLTADRTAVAESQRRRLQELVALTNGEVRRPDGAEAFDDQRCRPIVLLAGRPKGSVRLHGVSPTAEIVRTVDGAGSVVVCTTTRGATTAGVGCWWGRVPPASPEPPAGDGRPGGRPAGPGRGRGTAQRAAIAATRPSRSGRPRSACERRSGGGDLRPPPRRGSAARSATHRRASTHKVVGASTAERCRTGVPLLCARRDVGADSEAAGLEPGALGRGAGQPGGAPTVEYHRPGSSPGAGPI